MSARRKKVVAAGTTEDPQPEMRLRWTHHADADLAFIYNYIADDDPHHLPPPEFRRPHDRLRLYCSLF